MKPVQIGEKGMSVIDYICERMFREQIAKEDGVETWTDCNGETISLIYDAKDFCDTLKYFKSSKRMNKLVCLMESGDEETFKTTLCNYLNYMAEDRDFSRIKNYVKKANWTI